MDKCDDNPHNHHIKIIMMSKSLMIQLSLEKNIMITMSIQITAQPLKGGQQVWQ